MKRHKSTIVGMRRIAQENVSIFNGTTGSCTNACTSESSAGAMLLPQTQLLSS